jgi:hypothetical protein
MLFVDTVGKPFRFSQVRLAGFTPEQIRIWSIGNCTGWESGPSRPYVHISLPTPVDPPNGFPQRPPRSIRRH